MERGRWKWDEEKGELVAVSTGDDFRLERERRIELERRELLRLSRPDVKLVR